MYAEALLRRHFPAMAHADFRYMWLGNGISLMGTWMQNIALSWVVLSMTQSPLLLGLTGAVQFIPVTCFSLFAGVWIDRFPKRKILLLTQSIVMTMSFVLALLVLSDAVRYWQVLGIVFVIGLCSAFEMPTRQSYTIEMVGREDLHNAVALNSTAFNLARIVGPSVGALLMASVGAGWCFLLNAATCVPVLLALLRIQTKPYVRPKRDGAGVWSEIGDGIRYMARSPELARTILLVAVISSMAYNFNVMIPVFTREVLGAGGETYGMLMSCLGFGSLAGALAISLRSRRGPHKRLIAYGGLLIACMLVLNGLAETPLWSGVLLAAAGVCNIIFMTSSNSFIQMQATDEYRARVMSVYTLVFAGSAPLGNLIAGGAADRLGPDGAYMLLGACCMIGTLAALALGRMRTAQQKPS